MRGLLLFAPIALVVACTATPESETDGDVGDVGSTTSNVSKGCKGTRAELLAAAGGKRAEAISRGFKWLDAKVEYSQAKTHEGFRTDCSGFVSMCWNLKTSYNTAAFAGGTGDNEILPSFEALQPGDGLVRRSGGSGHAVLFVGWDDAAHTNACVLEQSSSANDMQFGVRSTASLKSGGYKAMKKDGMPDATQGVATPDDPAVDEPTVDEPTDDEPAAVPIPKPRPTTDPDPVALKRGDSCTADEQCNPGLSGTGLLCKMNKCAPGCYYDLQCPGALRCKEDNQCR